MYPGQGMSCLYTGFHHTPPHKTKHTRRPNDYLSQTLAFSDPFHNRLMSWWSKSCKTTCSFYVENDDPIKSQFCTCHDSWAVVTCANLWADGIIRIVVTSRIIFERFQLWAHKPFEKNSSWPSHSRYNLSARKPCDTCTRSPIYHSSMAWSHLNEKASSGHKPLPCWI